MLETEEKQMTFKKRILSRCMVTMFIMGMISLSACGKNEGRSDEKSEPEPSLTIDQSEEDASEDARSGFGKENTEQERDEREREEDTDAASDADDHKASDAEDLDTTNLDHQNGTAVSLGDFIGDRKLGIFHKIVILTKTTSFNLLF